MSLSVLDEKEIQVYLFGIPAFIVGGRTLHVSSANGAHLLLLYLAMKRVPVSNDKINKLFSGKTPDMIKGYKARARKFVEQYQLGRLENQSKAYWQWHIITDELVFRENNDNEQRFRLAQRGRYVELSFSETLSDSLIETIDANLQNHIEEKVCDAYNFRIENLREVDGEAAIDIAHNLVERYPKSETPVHLYLYNIT